MCTYSKFVSFRCGFWLRCEKILNASEKFHTVFSVQFAPIASGIRARFKTIAELELPRSTLSDFTNFRLLLRERLRN